MPATLKQMKDRLPPARRERVDALTAELIAEEASLQNLRKALNLTQVEMAELLDVGQDSISRMEKRTDHRLSTLQSYVEALGGKLEITAKFPDRPPVVISPGQ